MHIPAPFFIYVPDAAARFAASQATVLIPA